MTRGFFCVVSHAVDILNAISGLSTLRGIPPLAPYFRATETRFAPENLPHNLHLVELLKSWAIRKNAAPGQIALAWLLARKPWIVPIPGTTNKDHMLQNTAATSVSLTLAEMTELTRSLDAITIQGQRLPDAVQVYSDVEAPMKS